MAGETFNLGSPKQLGDILFGRMGLEGGKKTKTGAWATGANVLDELALKGVPLAQKVLDWRQVVETQIDLYRRPARPISTRAPGACTPPTIRPSVLTGRLSSNEPNLQNIPVRTEDGRKIRRAFVAAPGKKLISADYSQIELRILAHIADIGALKQAFADGLDIHAMTASEMFNVPLEEMTVRCPPARQGDQFRHHLRHFGLRARQPARPFRARRRAITSPPISSVSPASRTTWMPRRNW